jgi:hypothetical protein
MLHWQMDLRITWTRVNLWNRSRLFPVEFSLKKQITKTLKKTVYVTGNQNPPNHVTQPMPLTRDAITDAGDVHDDSLLPIFEIPTDPNSVL